MSSIPLWFKVVLSRFRCSNFRIAVNKGRYSSKLCNDWLCQYCLRQEKNYTDNEEHIFSICELNVNLMSAQDFSKPSGCLKKRVRRIMFSKLITICHKQKCSLIVRHDSTQHTRAH